MDESNVQSSPQPTEPPPPVYLARSPLNAIFLNQRGLRSGWRIVVYFFQILVLGAAINFLLGRVFHLPKTENPAMWQMLLQEGLSLVIVFAPALVMSRLESRLVGEYGLPLKGLLGARFWHGCLLGLAEISVLIACIAAFGGYKFGALDIHGAAIARWAVLWAFFFLLVGLFEEFAFRGYLQFTLADGIGFWPAAWILSLGFGAVHLTNQGESPVGALSVASIALIFALALKRTGNLWLVVGWHAAFDFGETFLFSVPNSGNVFEGHLSSATLQGPAWLTGGSVGPEGSVFSFLTMAIAALYVQKVFPSKPAASSSVSAGPAASAASLPVA